MGLRPVNGPLLRCSMPNPIIVLYMSTYLYSDIQPLRKYREMHINALIALKASLEGTLSISLIDPKHCTLPTLTC